MSRPGRQSQLNTLGAGVAHNNRAGASHARLALKGKRRKTITSRPRLPIQSLLFAYRRPRAVCPLAQQGKCALFTHFALPDFILP